MQNKCATYLPSERETTWWSSANIPWPGPLQSNHCKIPFSWPDKHLQWGIHIQATSPKVIKVSAFIHKNIRGCHTTIHNSNYLKVSSDPARSILLQFGILINKCCPMVLTGTRVELPGAFCRTLAWPQTTLDLSQNWTSNYSILKDNCQGHDVVQNYQLSCHPTTPKKVSWNQTPGHQESNQETWWSLTLRHVLPAFLLFSCHLHISGTLPYTAFSSDSPSTFKWVSLFPQ